MDQMSSASMFGLAYTIHVVQQWMQRIMQL